MWEGRGDNKTLIFERIVWLVWNMCYAWLGVSFVDSNDVVSHFLHFNLCNVPNYVNVAWRSIWIVVIGEIWIHRNKYIFKGGVIDHLEIFSFN